MMSSYTLRLVSLVCYQVQEADGDEIYMKVNGEPVFSWEDLGGVRFHQRLDGKRFTTTFDFRTCRYNTPEGWGEVDAYSPERFMFKGQTAPLTIELWESDEGNVLRGDDDYLGRAVISAADGHVNAEIKKPFVLAKAGYELTYIVTLD